MNKKNFILVLPVLFLSLLIMPSTARASFFDDVNQWSLISAGDPLSRTGLAEQGDNLVFTAQGWDDSYDAYKVYASKWAFDASSDFEFSVDYHYDHIGEALNDKGGISAGIFSSPLQGGEPSVIGISAENNVLLKRGNLVNKNIYSAENPEDSSWWTRTSDDGTFKLSYDADTGNGQGLLTLSALEDGDSVGEVNYAGLTPGSNFFHVYLGGWSQGANLESGDAYLSNFNINGGNVTPEPISSALFLLGGAALIGKRRFSKKS